MAEKTFEPVRSKRGYGRCHTLNLEFRQDPVSDAIPHPSRVKIGIPTRSTLDVAGPLNRSYIRAGSKQAVLVMRGFSLN